MFDRNSIALSHGSLRPARAVGLTMAALVVAALAFFVASPASANHRHTERGHYVGWWGHAQHHGHGHHDKHHHYRHDRHSGWYPGFHIALPLPHFELRFGKSHRSHRNDRDRSHVRDHRRKHRDRSDVRERSRKHRNRDRHDRRDRREDHRS